jgi:hypothetical protein
MFIRGPKRNVFNTVIHAVHNGFPVLKTVIMSTANLLKPTV